jgi:hypothetical protein
MQKLVSDTTLNLNNVEMGQLKKLMLSFQDLFTRISDEYGWVGNSLLPYPHR